MVVVFTDLIVDVVGAAEVVAVDVMGLLGCFVVDGGETVAGLTTPLTDVVDEAAAMPVVVADLGGVITFGFFMSSLFWRSELDARLRLFGSLSGLVMLVSLLLLLVELFVDPTSAVSLVVAEGFGGEDFF